jgi:hypothetical protein
MTAARIGFLPQFTLGQADQASADNSGATWYRVSASGLTGWIRGDLLIDEPAYYKRWGSWSFVFPNASFSGGGEYIDYQSAKDLHVWWILEVRATPQATDLPELARWWRIHALHPELYDRTEQVSVWTYTATKRVVRASARICVVPEIAKARNWGWPYVTVVDVVTTVRAYQFRFLTPDSDSSVVRKLIDSINITE